MSIQSVRALSLDKARGLRATPRTLMISILGAQEAQARRRPALAGWRSVLVLEFEDMQEIDLTGSCDPPREWPLEPTVQQHAELLGLTSANPGGRVPSLSHARQIVEFVNRHHESEEMLDLIVHCQAGVSRSVMVAHHALQWTGAAVDARVAALLPYANQRLGRLLEMAQMEHGMRLSTSAPDSDPALCRIPSSLKRLAKP